ncbi:MAG: hypothetical protein DDT39_01142 [Firmicutes bacterium]|nr:hypothetical protein [candidate division NPL-UPA2 bacterium]
MTTEIEKRIHLNNLRVERSSESTKIRGYAAVFNSLSEDLGGFLEQISPGAFVDAIARDDVRALINHDSNLVLGRNRSGTLVMREDATGLGIEITPPDTQAARDLVELMGRGDVTQMSFAFSVSKEDQSWEQSGAGPWIRTVHKVARLYDVSVVTYPAYPSTSAAIRALEEYRAKAGPPKSCAKMRSHLLTVLELWRS